MPKTSLDWWTKVLTEPGKLEDWLKRQYHSEASSVSRIQGLLNRVKLLDLSEDHPLFEEKTFVELIRDRTSSAKEKINFKEWEELLLIIAADEQKHATQVSNLMVARGLSPRILSHHKSKYFDKFQEGMGDSIWSWAAVAAYAELTSLTRFKAILAHPETPIDIRREFESILFEEEFHYAAFRRLAGQKAMKEAEVAHIRGLQAVGISLQG